MPPNDGCGGCCDFIGRVLDDLRRSDGGSSSSSNMDAYYTPSLALSNGIPIVSWRPIPLQHHQQQEGGTGNINNTNDLTNAQTQTHTYPHHHPPTTRLVSTTATRTINMDHIAYSGYLYKQSKHLKRFRRRYCILIIDKLYTFKQEEDVLRGLVTEVLDLALADYLVEWEITPRVPNYNVIAGKYSFEIGTEAETPTRREWMFAADTEHERHQWIHHLGSYCRHVWRPPGSGLEGRVRRLYSTTTRRRKNNNEKEEASTIPPGRTVTMPPKPQQQELSSNEQLTKEDITTLKDDNGNVINDRVELINDDNQELLTRAAAAMIEDDDDVMAAVEPESSSIVDDCIFTDCCCICLKEFNDEEVWQLCCGHYFCIKCIQNWSRYKRTCPVCRDVF